MRRFRSQQGHYLQVILPGATWGVPRDKSGWRGQTRRGF